LSTTLTGLRGGRWSREVEGLLLQRPIINFCSDAVAAWPVRIRVVIILHEIEGLAYKEMARHDIAIGTVMSRLSPPAPRLDHDLTEYGDVTGTGPRAQD